MTSPTTEQVTEALRAVIDPELRQNIVDLGMVRSIEIEGGRVDVVVSLTTAGCPIRAHFQQAVAHERRARSKASTSVGVGFDVLTDDEKSNLQQKLGRPGGLPEGALAQVKNVICVASGKGGVGKSTMTANLAAALQAEGKTAGALDADVYGYSIPRMLGVNGRPEVNGERKIMPLTAPSGVKVMSIGFFVEENAAVVWRGPMLHKAIQQFLEDVDWGELDYLLLDLPPGTGDVSMTLAQLLPQARIADRHDAAAGRADRRPPRRRDGRQGRPRGARRDREHVRLHHARRPALHDLRRGRRPDAGRRARRAAARQGPAAGGAARARRRRHAAGASPSRRRPASVAIREAARGIIAATPVELPVMQAPAAPMPEPVAVGATAGRRHRAARDPGRRLSRRAIPDRARGRPPSGLGGDPQDGRPLESPARRSSSARLASASG